MVVSSPGYVRPPLIFVTCAASLSLLRIRRLKAAKSSTQTTALDVPSEEDGDDDNGTTPDDVSLETTSPLLTTTTADVDGDTTPDEVSLETTSPLLTTTTADVDDEAEAEGGAEDAQKEGGDDDTGKPAEQEEKETKEEEEEEEDIDEDCESVDDEQAQGGNVTDSSNATTVLRNFTATRCKSAALRKQIEAEERKRRAAAAARARALAPPKTTVKGKATLTNLGGKYAKGTSGVDGQKCDKRCPGRLLCNKPLGKTNSQGVCRCPILFSGDKKCTTPPKKLPAWCGHNMHSTKLTQLAELGDRFNRMQSVGRGPGVRYRFTDGKNDIGQLADWTSCAVVGSSGGMLKKRAGAAIDKHTAVIRFNEAPTKKYERHVGKKTTIRLQNYDHCGFSEGSELCMQYSLTGETHKCLASWWKRGKCKVIKPSRRLQHYVQGYWQLGRPKSISANWNKVKEAPHKISAGFFGIMLAMHLCAKVSVYGFGVSPLGHYFRKEAKNKGFNRNKDVTMRHFWNGERACLAAIGQEKSIPVGVVR
ncbi:sialyltransferase [Pycnococcus provasolii]